MEGGIGGTLGEGTLRAGQTRFTGSNPSPHQVLAGNRKRFFHVHGIRPCRMPGERNAMAGAPVMEGLIVGSHHMRADKLGMIRTDSGGAVSGKEKQCEVSKTEPGCCPFGLHAVRPADESGFDIASERTGFIREHGTHSASKEARKLCVIAVMRQADKAGHRIRIQKIGCSRCVWCSVIFFGMQSADGAVGEYAGYKTNHLIRAAFGRRMNDPGMVGIRFSVFSDRQGKYDDQAAIRCGLGRHFQRLCSKRRVFLNNLAAG